MEESALTTYLGDVSLSKRLDDHSDFIRHQLNRFPNLSAVKIARKLRARAPELVVSDRSIRRYVQTLKEEVSLAQKRYYEPILDDVPGEQCQIDPGELRGVLIGGEEQTVHVVVLVLSYSRLMYVGLSLKPLNTDCFIQMHDEAFRYFGGRPEECVYDQTKLVVLHEQFRELEVNPRFLEYATAAGFRIHACEGYDPESKGKVEAGVKYVKQDCFYGEQFDDVEALRQHVQDWVNEVANERLHGTTGERPRERFESGEKSQMKSYLTPVCVSQTVDIRSTRRADKTGLISWKANKYSVPMTWQQARVGVKEIDRSLVIYDLGNDEEIARHHLSQGKGQIIKNTNHYRNHEERVLELERDIGELCGAETGKALCRQLKLSEPKVYKDQLVAVKRLLSREGIDSELVSELAQRPGMTARQLKDYLEAAQCARKRGREAEHDTESPEPLDLSQYQKFGHPSGQEANP